MTTPLRRLCGTALLLGLLVAGCGGSGGSQVQTAIPATTTTAAAQTQAEVIAQAMVEDPDTATTLAPSAHLNPFIPAKQASSGGMMSIPVATLQSNYETAFCGLSASHGVSIASPQSMAKIDFIKSQRATGNFDLLRRPIADNSAGVTAVLWQPVSYQTTVTLPSGARTFSVSGGLLMPEGIDKAHVRGVVVYFHGTTFNKTQVGSDYTNNPETRLMAEVFASQGYIVVMPDYIGQGADYLDIHPYVLYPTVSVQTALDMLAAVKPHIVAHYQYAGGDPPLRLFSAGYSEGGSYSLWFNTVIRSTPAVLDPFYSLTHSVGMEGAYSLSSVIKDYLFTDVAAGGANPFNVQTQALVNLVKPMLGADALVSYATFSVSSSYADVFNMKFFDLDCFPQGLCDVNGQHLNVAQAFQLPDTTIATPIVYAALGKSANGCTYPSADVVFSSHNAVQSLVSTTLLGSGWPLLLQTLQVADTNLTAADDQGVSIITLSLDSVVVPNNFDVLHAAYPAKIKNAIKIDVNNLMVLSPFSPPGVAYFVPVDHLHGLVYEYLYALNIFNSFAVPKM